MSDFENSGQRNLLNALKSHFQAIDDYNGYMGSSNPVLIEVSSTESLYDLMWALSSGNVGEIVDGFSISNLKCGDYRFFWFSAEWISNGRYRVKAITKKLEIIDSEFDQDAELGRIWACRREPKPENLIADLTNMGIDTSNFLTKDEASSFVTKSGTETITGAKTFSTAATFAGGLNSTKTANFSATTNFTSDVNFAGNAKFNGRITNTLMSGGRINLHPEGSPTTLTYFTNDLTGLRKMGGTCTVTRTDKDGNVLGNDLTQEQKDYWFDGTTSYGSLVGGGKWQSSSPSTEPTFSTTDIVTIYIRSWKDFAWTTTAGIGFGSASWRAKDIKVECGYESTTDGTTSTTWKEIYNVTNSDLELHHFNANGPSGTTGEKSNCWRIRLTNFNNASEIRIAGIWVIGYNSRTLASTLMSRINGTMLSNLNPEINNTYYLGTSSKKWYEVNASYMKASSEFQEGGVSLKNKYARLSEKNTFTKDITVLGNSFDDMYKKVAQIYGSYVFFQTDATRAYEKIVPNNALAYANINKLGGMSYVSKNMIKFGQEPWKTVSSEVSFLNEQDIRVTALVSANSSNPVFHSVKFRIDPKNFDIKKKYRLKIDHIVSSSTNRPRIILRAYYEDNTTAVNLAEKNSITVSETSMDATINIPAWSDSGKTALQNASYVELNLFSNDQGTCEAGAYVDYCGIYLGEYDGVQEDEMVMFDGVQHSPVTHISTDSGNLFKLENGTRSDNGYSIRCLDGEIYFSGQATKGTANMNFDLPQPLPPGTYSISLFNNIKGSAASTVFGVKTSHWENAYHYTTTSVENNTLTVTVHSPIVSFFIGGLTEKMDLTGFYCYPMIVKGSTPATEYKLYSNPYDDRAIPEELIQGLEDYGCGVNDTYYNYIDFVNKQYVQNCGTFYINGTEKDITLMKTANNSGADTGFYRFRVGTTTNKIWQNAASNTINANLVQDSGIPNYTSWSDYDNLRYEQISIQSHSFFIVIDKTKASTVDELRTWLADHPISGVYTFNAPVKTSIASALVDFDDTIGVIENGTTRFNNQDKQAVPSEIEYQVAGVDN